jgi:hypothetical protein
MCTASDATSCSTGIMMLCHDGISNDRLVSDTNHDKLRCNAAASAASFISEFAYTALAKPWQELEALKGSAPDTNTVPFEIQTTL